jgi:Uncharacterized protein conserved in bacteria
MGITRMTAEEVRDKYRLTPERLAFIKAIKDEDIDFSDIPELDDELLKTAKRVGRPKKAACKKAITIRFSPEVLAGLKKTGAKWQTLADDVLKEWLAWRNLL